MKSAIAAVAILALIGTQTLAAESALPAGKPAGVQEAQRHHRFPLLLTAAGVIIAAAAIVVATQSAGDATCGSACNSTTNTSP